MERLVCQTLADQFRSFCNFQFMFPLRFLGFIAEKIGIQAISDSYERQILTWRIESHLQDRSGAVFEGLNSYLSGENSSLKRFQLARKLANIFDQYQVMRPDMLAGWIKGRSSTDEPAEKWQMELWQRLAAEPRGGDHRGLLFRQVIDRLAAEKSFQLPLPERISVLGLHIMPPIFLEFLKTLAGHSDIHLFILSPCSHYWGDVETKRAEYKRSLKHLSLQSRILELSHNENHPLLASLGQQGRDFQKMMLENIDFEVEFESFIDPLEETELPTLLQRVQSDLLRGEVTAKKEYSTLAVDLSIQIVSCHSVFREIAVLKDHLLRLLHDDPSLQLRDILVMAPDIQDYAHLVPAVFDDIQYSIADNSLKRQNRYIAVFLSLLDLFTGRFGWNEMMELLRQPVVYPHFGLGNADMDCLQQWVLGSSIRWGLSEKQRQNAGLSSLAEGSWSAGIARLLMGYAIDTEEPVDGVYPFADIEGSGAGIVGGLCQFVAVIERTYELLQSGHHLSDWSSILLRLMADIFGESDQKEYLELRNILMQPVENYALYHQGTVDFEVIRHWFDTVVRERSSSKGFLQGKLTFCSMLPMRSVPFRVVCLLGLNDGVFPGKDKKPTFDLMDHDVRLGDRSSRADDRYQFLEAVLAARSNLYLSYIGQSIRTNETIPPSVAVAEFIDFLTGSYGVESIVVPHPLHPFHRDYFVDRGNDRLFSYNDYYCTTAENLQKAAVPRGAWWQGEIEGKPEPVGFKDLLSFYRNPQEWFVRNCLGVALKGEAELPEESEIFKTRGLENYIVNQEMIHKSLQQQDSHLLARLQAEGRWPLGAPGSFLYQKKENELALFIESVRRQRMGASVGDRFFELDIGRYTLSGTLSNLYENGVMLFRYAKLKGKDLLAAWLHHQVANVLFGRSTSVLVAADVVFRFSPDDQLPGLDLMLEHFSKGCRKPSPFLVEPAFCYCQQVTSKRASIPPIDKAVKNFRRNLENDYEPSWRLLFEGLEEGLVLGSDFESFCLEIMNPIWSAADEEPFSDI